MLNPLHRRRFLQGSAALRVTPAALGTLRAPEASELVACEGLGQLGVRTPAIEAEGCELASARHRIRPPRLDPAPAPLPTVLPLRRLAGCPAETSSLDPNTCRRPKHDETRLRVSRRPTRRLLLGAGL